MESNEMYFAIRPHSSQVGMHICIGLAQFGITGKSYLGAIWRLCFGVEVGTGPDIASLLCRRGSYATEAT